MGYKDIVKLLLNYKNINIDLRNNKGMFPKDMAITNDIAKLFDMYEEKKGMKKKDKNNGEDINGENNGQKGGFFASLRNNRQIEKLLNKVNQYQNKLTTPKQ